MHVGKLLLATYFRNCIR